MTPPHKLRAPAHPLHALHTDEDGFLTLINLVGVLLCVLLMVLVMNLGNIVLRKIELQNAADAAAYSGAVWQARGMNAITATNHVIGEMTAFVILHHAVGGDELDSDTRADVREQDRKIRRNLILARQAAALAGATVDENVYQLVLQKDGIHAGRTVLDSKNDLKKWLTFIYINLAAAEFMIRSNVPPVVAAGVALRAVMQAFEQVIGAEYRIIKAFHRIAKSLQPLKELLRDQFLPTAKQYTDDVRRLTPQWALAASRAVAEKNGQTGWLTSFGPQLELPVTLDPFAHASQSPIPETWFVRQPFPTNDCGCPSVPADNMRMQLVKTSQLARASFPWVNYHREPILNVLKAVAPFSNAKAHYFDHSNGAAKQLCDELQRSSRHDLGLFVMRYYPAPDKGYALWTEDPVFADQLFSVVGMAHGEKPMVVGSPGVFRQPHPNGRVALAQAIIYNGNQQRRSPRRIDLNCKRIVPVRQANVGWDTLNWRQGSRPDTCRSAQDGEDARGEEHRPFELVGIGIPAEFPEICINWQAKLVPMTGTQTRELIRKAHSGGLPTPFAQVVGKMIDDDALRSR